ncbi:MAG: FAD:protein FMN transferase [Bacteroidales bacterium]
MKNWNNSGAGWLYALIVCLIVISCTSREYRVIDGFTQGTTFHIAYSDDAGESLDALVEEMLNSIDSSLSVYNKESIVSKVNRGEDTVLDTLFIKVFNKSVEINIKSEGLFDVSASPIFNLWGFGFKNRESVTKEKIDSVKSLTGMEKFRIEGSKVLKEKAGAELNFNAIAQGYSADVIASQFDKRGVKNYLIEIGGEIYCKGLNPKGKKWSVGIDKPIDGNNIQGEEIQDVLLMQNCGLATSGNYRKFYEENGEKFSHSINPITGYPAKNSLLSATVVAPDAMTADAYATWFMVAGLDKAIKIIESDPSIEGYLVYSEGGAFKVYKSKGINLR